MRAYEKRKQYRKMVADKMKSGLVSDANGGWKKGEGSIGQMIVSGANHKRV